MNDPQSLRRRAERILPVPDSGGGAQPSTAQYAPYAPRVIAVLDHIDGDVLYWQRIRYANRRTPKVGEYKRYGPIEKGYPLETAEASDYESVKWGSGAIDKTTTPVWATFRHGAWIIELMGGSGISQFRIVDFTSYPDSVTAKTWDGATLGAAAIQIAKPFLVRRTPFHGKTVDGKTYIYTSNIKRDVTLGTGQIERQVIVPAYWSGQTIYAARGIVGGTDATYLKAGVPTKIEWLELNDARAFTRKASQT